VIELHPSEDPVASILVLCQDNLELLGECLASVARSTDAAATPYEVIVLFQQMSRAAVDSFLTGVSGVRALHAGLNLGFGGGNNFAAKHARGTYLVFLNDDAAVQPGWLGALIAAAEADETVGAVGSRILFPDGRLQEAGVVIWSDASCYPLGRGDAPGALSYSYARTVDYASANGLLVRRSTFESAGGFDERYFPGYYEDVDLCMTIRHRLGQRIAYEPRSVILHHESATANRDPDFRAFLFRRHQAAFRSKWAAELEAYPAPEPDSKAAVERAVLRARGNPKRVLVIDDRVPRAGMGSGFGRTADLFGDLHAAGFAVAMYPADRRHLPAANALAGLGVDLIVEPLAEHLARPEKEYDLAIVSRPHNFRALIGTIRAARPATPVIYDVEALYHRRLWLQANAETDPERRARLEAEAAEMQALEAEIARSADRMVAISESELAWLQSVEGHAPVEFMRPLSPGIRMAPPALESRDGAVFVAGWLGGDHSPNVEALRWYVQRVLPLVRGALPHFVTRVTGANPPLRVQAMEGDGVELLGHVDSVERLYAAARIAISPMLAGAGVKIKTIEAMQFGTPVVATAVGAEGLGLAGGQAIDVSDDPAEFAAQVVALATDDGLWMRRREELGDAVARWERERLSWGGVVERALSETPVRGV
jgi:O-antigen biosynthesis protein